MPAKLSRRTALGAVAFTITLFLSSFSREATAVLSPLLVTIGVAKPFIALAQIIEIGLDHSQGQEQSRKLSGIATQLYAIAERQDTILAELADQRIFMRAELKRAFLDNDVREMIAISQRFKVALVSDEPARTDALRSVAGRMDELSIKLSTYGLAAVPAYVTAMALENGIHYALGSSSRVFLTVNEVHKLNLNSMLNGRGPESLSQAVAQNPSISPAELRELYHGGPFDIPRDFELTQIVISWGNSLDKNRMLTRGYTYLGYKDGQPVLKEFYTQNSAALQRNLPYKPDSTTVMEFSGGGGDWRDRIPALANHWRRDNIMADRYYTYLDSDSLPVFQERTAIGMKQQYAGIYEYYRNLYDPSFGPNVTEATPKPIQKIPLTEAQEGLRRILVDGITALDKIVATHRNTRQ